MRNRSDQSAYAVVVAADIVAVAVAGAVESAAAADSTAAKVVVVEVAPRTEEFRTTANCCPFAIVVGKLEVEGHRSRLPLH